MKTIGIVGGVGPYAGLDLARKIFDNTVAGRDQEHLPVSLLSFPHRIGDRTEFLLGKNPVNPGDAIADIMLQLEASGAELAAVPCNTAHAPPIYGRVRERLKAAGSKLKLVHMIEEVAARLKGLSGLRRVAPISTLGTYKLKVYLEALGGAGLEVVDPGEAAQARIHEAIYDREWGIKACTSPVTARARAALEAAVREAKDAGADALVLGCTELPLALPEAALFGLPLIDPTTVLARALVRESAPDRLRPI